ncbi:MAG: hypothetical protein IJC17_04300 [Clostridia bacterium]|nr:hypothetical protein [Clostridia bacterium]
MKQYNAPEIELAVIRSIPILTASDETDIINPYADMAEAGSVDPSDA